MLLGADSALLRDVTSNEFLLDSAKGSNEIRSSEATGDKKEGGRDFRECGRLALGRVESSGIVCMCSLCS